MRKRIDGIVKNGQEASLDESVRDLRKRFFLKALGIGGLSFLIFSMLPKKAQGMVFGSSMRSTDPIGLKNVSGTQINPATEDTLALVKTNTDKLDANISTLAKESGGNLDDIKTGIDTLNSLVPFVYDYVALDYTGDNLTEVSFKLGGPSGAEISTLTLAYTDDKLTSVTKS